MTVDVEIPPIADPRRSASTDVWIVGAALAVAAAAALASRLGLAQAQPLVGAVMILSIAYAFSTNRRAIDLRIIAWGLGLQVVFALIVLKTSFGQAVFSAAGNWI